MVRGLKRARDEQIDYADPLIRAGDWQGENRILSRYP